jgi:beta-phosphoglucomutase family hydrolase
MIETNKSNRAAIFDMDGVIMDNHAYHLKAWQAFFKKFNCRFSKRIFERYCFGRTNQAILEFILKRRLSAKQAEKLAQSKEKLYRKLYGLVAKPVAGLIGFLKSLKRQGVKIALATSGPKANVDFALRKTGFRKFFSVILDAQSIKHSKPHPEIYLKAAKKLKISPKFCVVFEDSLAGIASGKRAGMKVVGLVTTLPKSRLKNADLIIKNFKGLTPARLERFLEK